MENPLEAGARVTERYVVEGLIGKGGMAEVHRARDSVTGSAVALKVLVSPGADGPPRAHVELFEREFHTLVHFAHPRVVAVHDYGVDRQRPFYAMELLDGGDLQTLAPLAWAEVCLVAYEICSALALVHSRGLVHRDVTPRNVRRTTSGEAKLMDFGLLSPAGATSLLAGTPPFVAPELLTTQSLDGRSDLFSLGATLYFALTGRPPFHARAFDKLRDAWRSSPAAPSTIVPGIPPAVDALVASLLRVDPGSRPKSAAEVMERLLPLLPSAPARELQVARAYLTTPRLVGRDALVEHFRKVMMQAVRRKGGGIVITGDEGTGRSRMLDSFVLEAKLVGATTIRVSAADATGPFGVASALARQLHAASPWFSMAAAERDRRCSVLFRMPQAPDDGPASGALSELVELTTLEHGVAQAALRAWILAFAEQRPLAIAVDDADRLDDASTALFASLTWDARSRRLAYAVTLPAAATSAESGAVGMIRSQVEPLFVGSLGPDEIRALLASVFGDVPHLTLLAERLHAVSDGRPRDCLALAQFLVDRGTVTHASGTWSLPAELPDGVLPESIEGALKERIAALGPLSRRLAAYLSLSLVGRLSRAELARMSQGAAALDAALHELITLRLVTGDTSGYAPGSGSLARVLTASLGEAEKARLHDDLAALHADTDAHPFVVGYHALQGKSPGAGVDRILARAGDSDARILLIYMATAQLGTAKTTRALALALDRAEQDSRPPRELQTLWVMLAGMSAQGDDASHYHRVRERWLERLKEETGWNAWQTLDPSLDPGARAMMAIGAAIQRFGETPEAERGLAPPDAIKQLVGYVVFSIAIAVRTFDAAIMEHISELLVPFAPLNPMVAAMLENARGTRLNGEGKRELAHARFREVLSRLGEMAGVDLAYVDKVRASIELTLGKIDVSLGIASVWVDKLSEEQKDANQAVGAQYLRKVAALQQGDWDEAESHRQKAELLQLQGNATSMFSTLAEELEAHAMARELTGLKQVRAGIHAMAELHPGWVPVAHLADAHYLRLRGDLEGGLVAARAVFESESAGAATSAWAAEARALAAELLSELNRPEEGLAVALRDLVRCERDHMPYLARTLAQAIAQCEAKLGRCEGAMARIEAVIAEQTALGVRGLQLGRAYELAARVAIAMSDRTAFARFAALARDQYRPGQASVLGGLYERLLEDARSAGLLERAEAPLQSGVYLPPTSRDKVTTAMAGCAGPRERAERALALLCDGEPPVRGHLFLIGEDGLERVASNVEGVPSTALCAFAREVLEKNEAGDDAHTTAMEAEAPEEADEDAFEDAAGNRYTALPLGAVVDGQFALCGVAVLTASNGRLWAIASLAQSIARTLIDAGDTQSFRAA